MSTAECRRCGHLISFVLASNGRWRPVEATYTALELEQDEVIALRVEGNWTSQIQSEIRVYRYHRCPEDPSLRLGPARTAVVRPEVVEPYACEVCGQIEDHNTDECPEAEPTPEQERSFQQRWIDGARNRVPRTQIGVDCPVCPGKAGEPCRNTHGHVRGTSHHQRGWVTAFADDEPWPPTPLQRGYRVMQRWLAVNADVFATPKES